MKTIKDIWVAFLDTFCFFPREVHYQWYELKTFLQKVDVDNITKKEKRIVKYLMKKIVWSTFVSIVLSFMVISFIIAVVILFIPFTMIIGWKIFLVLLMLATLTYIWKKHPKKIFKILNRILNTKKTTRINK